MSLLKNKLRLFYILVIVFIIAVFIYKNVKISENNIDEIAAESEKPKFLFLNSFTAVNDYAFKNKPEFDVSQIKTKKQKEEFSKKLKKEIFKLTEFPLKPKPVSKMLAEKKEFDDEAFIVQKLSILTSNSTISYAYLLVPKNISFPAPLIIAMHQRGDTKYGSEEIIGRIGDPSLFYGKELVERGYIVFSMDASSFGERKDFSGDSIDVREKRAAQDLIEFGYSPLGITIQEDIRSLDFLTNINIVDKNNIGCIGHSFGGVRCMYLAALDERIKVTVLSSSVSKFREDPRFGGTQTWLSILPNIARITTISGILSLISPRPLMIIYTENDPIYPAVDVELVKLDLMDLYLLLKQEQNLVFLRIPGRAHEFPIEYHEQAYEFFDKHLKNK